MPQSGFKYCHQKAKLEFYSNLANFFNIDEMGSTSELL